MQDTHRVSFFMSIDYKINRITQTTSDTTVQITIYEGDVQTANTLDSIGGTYSNKSQYTRNSVLDRKTFTIKGKPTYSNLVKFLNTELGKVATALGKTVIDKQK